MTVPGGVDYEALDDEPSDVLFMIAAPDTEADVHLEVLSRLMTLLMDEDFRAKLLSAKDTGTSSYRLSTPPKRQSIPMNLQLRKYLKTPTG